MLARSASESGGASRMTILISYPGRAVGQSDRWSAPAATRPLGGRPERGLPERLQCNRDARGALFDLLFRRRVREANVAGRSKGLTRHDGHVRRVEKVGGKVQGLSLIHISEPT